MLSELCTLHNLSDPSSYTTKIQRNFTYRYVIWSRIDQKTCLKSIAAANLVPVVVPLVLQGDQLETDVEGVRRQIEELGAQQIACVVTTTSCFAPRACDDVRCCNEQHKVSHAREPYRLAT